MPQIVESLMGKTRGLKHSVEASAQVGRVKGMPGRRGEHEVTVGRSSASSKPLDILCSPMCAQGGGELGAKAQGSP